MDLTIESHYESERLVLRLEGELDVYTAPTLREHLLQAVVGRHGEYPMVVVLDMASVSFMDSTTLGVMIGALKRLRHAYGVGERRTEPSGQLGPYVNPRNEPLVTIRNASQRLMKHFHPDVEIRSMFAWENTTMEP